MSDIVARLRDADTTRRIGESYADTHERRQRDRNEAADEIERLRADLEAADIAVSRLNGRAELQMLMRENNKLRAALEPLACTCPAKHQAECSRSEVDCPFWNALAALAEEARDDR